MRWAAFFSSSSFPSFISSSFFSQRWKQKKKVHRVTQKKKLRGNDWKFEMETKLQLARRRNRELMQQFRSREIFIFFPCFPLEETKNVAIFVRN